MTEPLVVVGAGGHGRELWSVVGHVNRVKSTWDLLGFVDDGVVDRARLDRIGGAHLGPVDWLVDHSVHFALGIGTPAVRRSIIARLANSPARPTTIVSPSASLGLDVELGDGVLVYEGSTITTNVRIGCHTHVNVGCAIQHDSVVGEFVQLGPAVYVNGDCVIEADVFVGTGAVIARGCRVGRGARVGAGAVVLADVSEGALVVGAPARPV